MTVVVHTKSTALVGKPLPAKMAGKVKQFFSTFSSQKVLTQGCWITQKLKIAQGPPMGYILAEISHVKRLQAEQIGFVLEHSGKLELEHTRICLLNEVFSFY